MECEYRANLTQKEYEGLQPGEFRFDYESWERRLGISKKQLVRAIKELTTESLVIIQVLKGKRGTSSKYFLTRFEEQKKEQNEELIRNSLGTEKGIENTRLDNCLGTEKGLQKEQNEEQKKDLSSQYNYLNIKSSSSTAAKKSYIDFFENNFHMPSSYEIGILNSFLHDGISEDLIIMAMERAVESNVRNIKYVKAILQKWLENNITTPEAVKAEQLEFERNKTMPKEVEHSNTHLSEETII